MKSLTDTFKLSNGTDIPCIGYGTWQIAEGREAFDAVAAAIKAGYRHIDTAAAYDNEKSVGDAIAASGLGRRELFVTTKLWNSDRGYDKTLKAFEKSLKNLGLEYVDLYLVHWPSNKPDGAKVNGDTWRAMEKLYADGLVRAIGVSNFLAHHLEALIGGAKVVPMVNQIEFHPGYRQPETVEFCKSHRIRIEAWSPLGRGRVLDDKQLVYIAEKYNKSTAQICIRWCLQNEIVPLPKTVTPSRMEENADVFDFEISPQDMAVINGLPTFGSSGLNPDTVTF